MKHETKEKLDDDEWDPNMSSSPSPTDKKSIGSLVFWIIFALVGLGIIGFLVSKGN